MNSDISSGRLRPLRKRSPYVPFVSLLRYPTTTPPNLPKLHCLAAYPLQLLLLTLIRLNRNITPSLLSLLFVHPRVLLTAIFEALFIATILHPERILRPTLRRNLRTSRLRISHGLKLLHNLPPTLLLGNLRLPETTSTILTWKLLTFPLY